MAFPYIFQFRNGDGPNFNVEIDTGSAASTPIISTPITSVTWVELNQITELPTGKTLGFNPGSDTAFPNAPVYLSDGFEYFNWRTGDKIRHPISKGTTPSTGEYSFDIWPDPNTVISLIDGGLTWEQLLSANTIVLRSDKHSVFYDYGTPYALGWKLGGSITIAES